MKVVLAVARSCPIMGSNVPGDLIEVSDKEGNQLLETGQAITPAEHKAIADEKEKQRVAKAKAAEANAKAQAKTLDDARKDRDKRRAAALKAQAEAEGKADKETATVKQGGKENS